MGAKFSMVFLWTNQHYYYETLVASHSCTFVCNSTLCKSLTICCSL